MKKKNFVFVFLFTSILVFSQIKFEKGYFITNSDSRVECFIKNSDWKNSPVTFEYKINESDKASIKSIAEVKQFEIYNQAKYVRRKVQIDQSSNLLNQLSELRDPEFAEKEVFPTTESTKVVSIGALSSA